VALAAVLIGACGGGGSNGASVKNADRPGGDGDVVTTTTSTNPAGPADGTGADAAPDPAGGQPAQAQPGTQGAAPAPKSSDAPAPPGDKPFAGTYKYHSVGNATLNGSAQPIDREAATLIEDLSPSDQRLTASGEQGTTIQVLRYSSDKVELVSLEMKGAVNKKFQPPKPVLFSPAPGAVGRSWSWEATSTDGLTHVKQTSRIDRNDKLVVGGQTLDVFVVETDITITGDVSATGHLTASVSPKYRLLARSHSTLKGTYATFSFASDVTSELLGLRPS
jgi:hypothetical protein